MSDKINHPGHYTYRQHECIDEMLAVFGKDTVIDFCVCNAWKYRYRAGYKDDSGHFDLDSYSDDMSKADWYLSKAIDLIGEERS